MIETAAAKTCNTYVIKIYHNLGGLPEDIKMSLVDAWF